MQIVKAHTDFWSCYTTEMNSPRAPFVGVLSNRPFFFLWLGQILSQISINMVLFILGLIVYKNTGSNTAVSGIFIAYGVPAVLFGMPAGTIVDFVEKRLIIFYSCILRALFVFGLLILGKSIPMVYALLFLNALVTQLYVPAEATLIPLLVGKNFIVSANSLFSFAYYGSMVIGFIAAGPVLKVFGPVASLTILALLFTLSAWTATKLPSQRDGHIEFFRRFIHLDIRTIWTKVIQSLASGAAYVRQSPVLFDAVLLLTGTQITFAMLGTLGPGFADRVMNIDVTDASLVIIGPVMAGLLAGIAWVGYKGSRISPHFLMRTGILGAGAILTAVSTSVYLMRFPKLDSLYDSPWLIGIEMVLFFLLGMFNSFIDVPANSILQKSAKGEMRGRVYGVLAAFVGGVGILPVLIGGVLADTIGVGKVIFLLGIAIIFYGMYRIRYNKIANG